MKKSICGASCAECPSKQVCPGCTETNGCPFGKQCYIAKYILNEGMDNYNDFKNKLIDEINELSIDRMEKITELFPLVGSFVNLEYSLPSGEAVKFLKDDELYLGAQVKNLFNDSGKTCFGVIARESFILICTYEENGANPKLILYKYR